MSRRSSSLELRRRARARADGLGSGWRAAALLGLLGTLALGGCGQKGPLYLPDRNAKVVTRSGAASAASGGAAVSSGSASSSSASTGGAAGSRDNGRPE